VVLACYDEEAVLEDSVREIREVLDGLHRRYEIVCVDDASRDRTAEILGELADLHGDVLRVVRHARNQGRGAAVSHGFELSRGRLCGYLDVDLEVHPRYIPALVSLLERGADVAMVRRIYAFQPRRVDRWLMSVGYAALVRRLLRLPVLDTETGYKFFWRERLEPVLREVQDDGWFWDTEFVARCVLHGLRVVEIPGAYVRRSDKASTVRPVRDSWRSWRRLLALRRRLAPQLSRRVR
jgi:glycosyltransferase involved in cell wall biosynthesis